MPTRSKIKTFNRKKAAKSKRNSKKKSPSRRARKARKNPEEDQDFRWGEDLESEDEFLPPELTTSSLEGASWKRETYEGSFPNNFSIEVPTEGGRLRGILSYVSPNSLSHSYVLEILDDQPHSKIIWERSGNADIYGEKEEIERFIEGYLKDKKKSKVAQTLPRGTQSKDPAIAEFFRSFKDEPVDSSEDFLEDVLRRKDRGDIDYWPNPKKKRRAKKKASKKPKKGSARELIATCRKHWDTYCERPNKTNLKKVFKHLDKMAESTAKSVKDERRKCMRSARAEAKDLGLKL